MSARDGAWTAPVPREISDIVRLVCVEGVIGAGKSFLLDKIRSRASEGRMRNVEVCLEAVAEWSAPQEALGSRSLIQELASGAANCSFAFQVLTLISWYRGVGIGLASLERDARGRPGVLFAERSVASNQIFAEYQTSLGLWTAAECVVYREINCLLSTTWGIPEVWAYLIVDTEEEDCNSRIRARGRLGEEDTAVSTIQVSMRTTLQEWLRSGSYEGATVSAAASGDVDLVWKRFVVPLEHLLPSEPDVAPAEDFYTLWNELYASSQGGAAEIERSYPINSQEHKVTIVGSNPASLQEYAGVVERADLVVTATDSARALTVRSEKVSRSPKSEASSPYPHQEMWYDSMEEDRDSPPTIAMGAQEGETAGDYVAYEWPVGDPVVAERTAYASGQSIDLTADAEDEGIEEDLTQAFPAVNSSLSVDHRAAATGVKKRGKTLRPAWRFPVKRRSRVRQLRNDRVLFRDELAAIRGMIAELAPRTDAGKMTQPDAGASHSSIDVPDQQ